MEGKENKETEESISKDQKKTLSLTHTQTEMQTPKVTLNNNKI